MLPDVRSSYPPERHERSEIEAGSAGVHRTDTNEVQLCAPWAHKRHEALLRTCGEKEFTEESVCVHLAKSLTAHVDANSQAVAEHARA